MKKILLALTLLTTQAFAVSAGFIWDGQQFDLSGYQLIQDSKIKSDFYWLPKKFRIKISSTFNDDGTITNTPMASHQIVHKDTGSFSVYNFTLILEKIPKTRVTDADFLLKRQFGLRAQLKGMLPACGLNVAIPKIIGPSISDISVTFGISESQGCDQAQTPSEFVMSIEAPISREPALSNMIRSKAGIPLPQIVLLHPSTYSDKVSLTIDAYSLWENLSQDLNISGAYSIVELGLKKKVKETMQALAFTGHMNFDIKEQDPSRKEAMRRHYEDIFVDILTKSLFNFQGIKADAPEDLNMSTQSAKNGNYVSATFSMSEAQARKKEKIHISMENAVYSTIKSQLTIDLSQAFNMKIN